MRRTTVRVMLVAAVVALTTVGWSALVARHGESDRAPTASSSQSSPAPTDQVDDHSSPVTPGSGAVAPSDAASIVADKRTVGAEHDATARPEGAGPASPEKGVRITGEAPFSVQDFRATSHWGGVLEGAGVVVYAGRDGHDDTTGEVVVLSAAGERTNGGVDRLSGVGALTIVDATDGGELTLTDAAGLVHHHDAATASFTD